MTVHIRRVYDTGGSAPGKVFLVDRVWPRGIRKDALPPHEWVADVAPSAELRRWFGHKTERWPEFRTRYLAELDASPGPAQPIIDAARVGDVVLLFGARDVEHNNAVVLQEWISRRL